MESFGDLVGYVVPWARCHGNRRGQSSPIRRS
jgi:hypothetical protein